MTVHIYLRRSREGDGSSRHLTSGPGGPGGPGSPISPSLPFQQTGERANETLVTPQQNQNRCQIPFAYTQLFPFTLMQKHTHAHTATHRIHTSDAHTLSHTHKHGDTHIHKLGQPGTCSTKPASFLAWLRVCYPWELPAFVRMDTMGGNVSNSPHPPPPPTPFSSHANLILLKLLPGVLALQLQKIEYPPRGDAGVLNQDKHGKEQAQAKPGSARLSVARHLAVSTVLLQQIKTS